jgi:hypothetical protein
LRNAQAGVRVNLGSAANTVDGNESASNTLYGISCSIGSGTPAPGNDGRPKQNLFLSNRLHDNGGDPIRVADSDDNTFMLNTVADLGGKLRFQRSLRTVLDANDIPEGLIVRTEGDASSAGSTYLRNQMFVKIELGTNGSSVFLDAGGRVYQPDEGALLTLVTTNGTSLTLTTDGIGASTDVIARELFTRVTTGSAFVHNLVWTNLTTRQWSVDPGFTGQTLSFTVGSLLANTEYVVRRSGLPFTNLFSGAAGQVQFSDSPEVAAPVVYTLAATGTNNTPPTLPNQSTRTIQELTTLTVTNTANDAETPRGFLSYGLLAAPSNARISASGIITWTPTEAQGPSTNTFVVMVSDDGSPPLHATNSFVVIVTEVNSPPIMSARSSVTLSQGETLQLNNTATDPDLPANHLSYRLLEAPSGAVIGATGTITWSPPASQVRTTNTFTTVVTDDGVPALSATNSFAVMVNPSTQMSLRIALRVGNAVVVSWPALPSGWTLQRSETLANQSWTDVPLDQVILVGSENQMLVTNLTQSACFRLRLSP